MIIETTTSFLTYHYIVMEDHNSTDEVSIPEENTRHSPRMSGAMRRKVGTKTYPWTTATAVEHTPPPPPPPPPDDRRMSVRRKFSDLLKYFNPFAPNLASQDEDIPAAKKPRLETAVSTAVDVGVGVAVHMTDSLTTASPSNIVPVAPRDAVAVSSPLQRTEAPHQASRRSWSAEEDAKLIDAVKKCGKYWVAAAALVPGRTNEQCRARWVEALDPNITPKMGKWTAEEDAKMMDAVTKYGKNWVVVAALVSGRNRGDCSARWANHLAPSANHTNRQMGRWTAEEDAKLMDAVTTYGKDWDAVTALVPGRRNFQCRQRWARSLDPSLDRKRGKWKAGEDAKLIDAVKKCGKDWVAVTALVPGRTNSQCKQRWLNSLQPDKNRQVGRWTAEKDAKMMDAVTKYGKNWVVVAALVSDRTSLQCRQRWDMSLDPSLDRRTGKWTAQEDAKLIAGVKKHGNNWVAVAALVSGRNNMVCRQRWANHLAPSANHANRQMGRWIAKEDAKLIDAVTKYGKDWAAVAPLVPGRTNSQCRDRWVRQLDPSLDRKRG
jgi:hypothetical protein